MKAFYFFAMTTSFLGYSQTQVTQVEDWGNNLRAKCIAQEIDKALQRGPYKSYEATYVKNLRYYTWFTLNTFHFQATQEGQEAIEGWILMEILEDTKHLVRCRMAPWFQVAKDQIIFVVNQRQGSKEFAIKGENEATGFFGLSSF